MSLSYTKMFSEISIKDVDLVGGKNASLGEMYQNLTAKSVKVPNGFAITVDAYSDILTHNSSWEALHSLLDNINPDDVKELQERGEKCRDIILKCEIPTKIIDEINEGFKRLKEEYGNSVSLAVRSSATAEDSPEASFAGQNDTYLNISTKEELLDAYKRCLASNFTDRSIHYKYDNGFEYLKVYLSVVVMKMVRSDESASGVMFSIDTESGFEDVVFINGAYGLGENIVQGAINPDTFYVHKPTFKKGFRSVLKRSIGSKHLKMVFSEKIHNDNIATEYTTNIETTPKEREKFCISDDDVMTLADYAIKIEEHYSEEAGYLKPMDIEWAKDAIDDEIYIVQARPETVESRDKSLYYETYLLKEKSSILLEGMAVGRRIGAGKIRIVNDTSEMENFQAGDILVANITSPDWEPIMKIASAIITNRGGRTCHAAIISRELGIPAIVGSSDATKILNNNEEVTVSCAEGEVGKVYKGTLKFEIQKSDLKSLKKPKTQVMMNLANPDFAFSFSGLPVDGIGLARMEFVIMQYIKVHPMALIHLDKLDQSTKEKVLNIVGDNLTPQEFFIQKLSEGIATIAASVYPKPCVVRMSDFKTNEYADLLGGALFEGVDENPMIGFRGASRYTHPNYQDGFLMECKAMKRVRDVMGFDNVRLMIPFCRRVQEGKDVISLMAKNGLQRGKNGLQIYMMCEIPSNVMLIDEFSDIFDGFSIGSNDLAQLTLGVDRDSEIVAFDYDERDASVLKMIKMAVEGAKRNSKHIGICGQAPSDYPEMAEFLINLEIDSISLTPDTVLKTMQNLNTIEKKA